MRTARPTLPWLLLLLALLVGAALRLQQVNWDAGQHLHPDERSITMRALELRLDWPPDWSRLLDARQSPLNPRFFAYGSLTIYVLRAAGHAAAWWSPFWSSYEGLNLVGRALSALFDLGTVALVFVLGVRLAGPWVGLLAAWLVALAPFHIQVAHFWAADTPLTFFVLLALLAALALARGGGPAAAVGLGTATGLALAFKISAAPLLLLAIVAPALAVLARHDGERIAGWRPLDAPAFDRIARRALLALSTGAIVFVVAQPYALLDWPTFFKDVAEQGAMARGTADLPYTRQYVGTTPYLYYLRNLLLWGFGPALGLAALAGWGYVVARGLVRPRLGDLVLLAWALPYFAIVGSFHAKFVRYLLPLTPVLALWAGLLLRDLGTALGRGRGDGETRGRGDAERGPRVPASPPRADRRVAEAQSPLALALAGAVLLPTALAALAFSAIYTRPHTRVAASAWLYQTVPPGAALANEHWDDPLPLSLPALDGRPRNPGLYRQVEMKLYDPDYDPAKSLSDPANQAKLDHIVTNLLAADYVILSSNRLYSSIPRSPERYPLTTRYYRLLFGGELGFAPVATFTSYPTLLGWTIVDDDADESFTVYDHPKVIIFKKTQPLPRAELVARLSPGLPAAAAPLLTLRPDELAAQRAGGTFAELFPADGLGNRTPLVVWLGAVVLVGLLALPLATLAFARLPDLGYGFARPLGLLGFAWLFWMGVSLGLVPGTRGGAALALALLAALGLAAGWWQRRALATLWRTRRALLLTSEAAFWVTFGVFFLQRLANPDLWHPVHGGEKPMDLAYLTAVAKSSVFPPYDPWFAGGYLNYYYFGQVMLSTLLKLTGIVPTVAYNLAVPTIAGYAASAAASLGLALGHHPARPRQGAVASGAAALFLLGVGNLGGAVQLWQTLWEVGGQPVRSALPGLAGLLNGLWGLAFVLSGQRAFPLPPLDWYWPSTRIIKDTINEFPFFTFLYADLHAHVIALPLFLSAVGLALNAALSAVEPKPGASGAGFLRGLAALPLGALLLGALWPTNAWDYPTGVTLLALGAFVGWWCSRSRRERASPSVAFSAPQPSRAGATPRARGAGGEGEQGDEARWLATGGLRLAHLALLVGLSVWLYRPFYARFVSFYSGVVPHSERSDVAGYLAIHGLFLFLLLSLAVVTLAGRYRQTAWLRVLCLGLNRWARLPRLLALTQRLVGKNGGWVGVMLFALGGLAVFVAAAALAGWLLVALLLVLLPLTVALLLGERGDPRRAFVWALLALGLGLGLASELVRLDGDVGRMNTVFKFYFQVWALWAVASAAAVVSLLGERLSLAGTMHPDFDSSARSARARPLPRPRPDAGKGGVATPMVVSDAPPSRTGKGAGGLGQPTSPPNPLSGSERGSGGMRWMLWRAALALLLAAVLVYPAVASRAKAAERFDPALPLTLDGMDYMRTAVHREEGRALTLRYDWEAIRWLQANVAGSPVVLEAQVPIYHWGGRVAIYTGLPTVLGWDWHQKQQRWGSRHLVDERAADVRALYSATDLARKLDLLRRYDVRYVFVGELERAYYPAAGLAAFEQLVGRSLERVYQNPGVVIYRMEP